MNKPRERLIKALFVFMFSMIAILGIFLFLEMTEIWTKASWAAFYTEIVSLISISLFIVAIIISAKLENRQT